MTPDSSAKSRPRSVVPKLLLASASPARLATLRSAGINPLVAHSGIDEHAELASGTARFGPLEPVEAVLLLARAKAEAVAKTRRESAAQSDNTLPSDTVVIGCDSLLEFDGHAWGKPADAEEARERWQLMRGRSGALHTGHWIIDERESGNAGNAAVGATATAIVHFAEVTDAEIDKYLASGEPLNVAGAFTIDGLGGWFIERIEGDHHAVVGVSLPLLRNLLTSIGIDVVDLWT